MRELSPEQRRVHLDRRLEVSNRDADMMQPHVLVGVPALAGLPPELARPDLGLELRRRLVALVAGDAVHVQAGGVGDVPAAGGPQAERPHPPSPTPLPSPAAAL